MKIYDMEGSEIMNLFSGSLSAGNHAFHYNIQELNNGNYLYVVASGKGYRSEKICLQK
ncbi:T9SS type A sorting domain-containing protein [candidate division KSB1 bacterium]